MAKKAKTVKVNAYNRSNPSQPSYKGHGNKPGPKTVHVKNHKRSK